MEKFYWFVYHQDNSEGLLQFNPLGQINYVEARSALEADAILELYGAYFCIKCGIYECTCEKSRWDRADESSKLEENETPEKHFRKYQEEFFGGDIPMFTNEATRVVKIPYGEKPIQLKWDKKYILFKPEWKEIEKLKYYESARIQEGIDYEFQNEEDILVLLDCYHKYTLIVWDDEKRSFYDHVDEDVKINPYEKIPTEIHMRYTNGKRNNVPVEENFYLKWCELNELLSFCNMDEHLDLNYE